MGNLATPISVRKLQRALHTKAKTEDNYRFYALYDKLYRKDILAHAYAKCRANRGAPGVDRQDFSDIEAYGVERWLSELAQGVTGYLMEEVDYFWGEEWLEDLHEWIANGLLALVVIHVAAAIFEGYRLKENLPLSMITGKRHNIP